MPNHTITLKNKWEIASGTMAFSCEKPEGFEFVAGQCVDLTHIDPPETDAEGNGRAFSLASAPCEEELIWATRMRDSAFKRVLGNLTPGATLEMGDPWGSFKLHNNKETPAVFLTGGIGVTAVRSIVRQAAADQRPNDIVLFVANRTPQEAAFLDDLKSFEQENPHYKCVPTMTRMEQSRESWDGETGYIDEAMLRRYVADIEKPIYYIDGPPAMVAGMRRMLLDAGVDEDNLRTDEFSGY